MAGKKLIPHNATKNVHRFLIVRTYIRSCLLELAVNRKSIIESCNATLQRLNLNHVDVLYVPSPRHPLSPPPPVVAANASLRVGGGTADNAEKPQTMPPFNYFSQYASIEGKRKILPLKIARETHFRYNLKRSFFLSTNRQKLSELARISSTLAKFFIGRVTIGENVNF